jgi:hypothetical protein
MKRTRLHRQRPKRKEGELPDPDLRTPSGRPLPY